MPGKVARYRSRVIDGGRRECGIYTGHRGGRTAAKRETDLSGGELRAADSIRRNVEWVRRYTDGNEAEMGRQVKSNR